ncbi:P-loop containing nucleoside triphosphate hydrolase protein [Dipodascopsis uninucleata]
MTTTQQSQATTLQKLSRSSPMIKHKVNVSENRERVDLPRRVTVHVEVLVRSDCTDRFSSIRNRVASFILENFAALHLNWSMVPDGRDELSIATDVERISVVEIQGSLSASDIVSLTSNCSLEIHVYQLLEDLLMKNALCEPNESLSVDDDGTVSALITELPCRSLDGLWESLIFDTDIKHKLLHFMSTIMLFSDHMVDYKIVSFNRMVLLHGPPGTGKTSLCKALAQKLTIRLCRKYVCGRLIEVSAHALFSKWFSESGKLVGKLFTEIRKLVSDTSNFVCILIDEIESLTAARKTAMSGSEPSDALRVVNAFLTELDKLRTARNVLILTTSNLLEAMDTAFLDRVDVKQFVGPPSTGAVYEILRSCILELIRCDLVTLDNFTETSSLGTEEYDSNLNEGQNHEDRDKLASGDYESLDRAPTEFAAKIHRAVRHEINSLKNRRQDRAGILIPPYTQASLNLHSKPTFCSTKLVRISQECKNLGGRTLRRLVVLAHAKHIHRDCCTLDELLAALTTTVHEEKLTKVPR